MGGRERTRLLVCAWAVLVMAGCGSTRSEGEEPVPPPTLEVPAPETPMPDGPEEPPRPLPGSFVRAGSHTGVTGPLGGTPWDRAVGLATVDVEGPPARAFVALGDSITEGYIDEVDDTRLAALDVSGLRARMTTLVERLRPFCRTWVGTLLPKEKSNHGGYEVVK